jgi:CheY-like chemotaxis protein
VNLDTLAGVAGTVAVAVVAALGRVGVAKVMARLKEREDRPQPANSIQREAWAKESVRFDRAQERIDALRQELDEERDHANALEVEHTKAAADAKVALAMRDMRIRELEAEIAKNARRGFAVPPGTRLHGVRVLLVEDDQSVSGVVAALLEGEGAVVVEVATCAEARRVMLDVEFDAALLDLMLPDERGTVLAREIRERMPVFLMSGYGASHATDEAEKAGAVAFFGKPPNIEELIMRIAQAVGRERQ